jgi:hypothetical protein
MVEGLARGAPGMERSMTVTDPDTPDPLNDPRTLQADPGAYGEGADLASAEDDATSAGEDELPTSRTLEDEARGSDVTGGASGDNPRA